MDEHIQEIKDGMTTKSSINSRENLFAEIYKRKAEFACANRKRGVTNSLFWLFVTPLLRYRIGLHGNPPKGVCHGAEQDNDCKDRSEILDHDAENLLSLKRLFPVEHFFFNSLYADDSGHQKAGSDCRDGHHYRVGQEIKEIQKLHTYDGYIC